MAIRYHGASYVTTEIELGKSLSDAPAHLKTTLSTLLTLSVCLYAVLVYVYNPMEQTNNSFILAWLMQLTSAYALVEKYPAI